MHCGVVVQLTSPLPLPTTPLTARFECRQESISCADIMSIGRRAACLHDGLTDTAGCGVGEFHACGELQEEEDEGEAEGGHHDVERVDRSGWSI